MDELITKRLKQYHDANLTQYHELKDEVAAQGITILRQSHDIEELVVENAELQAEVESLKDEIEGLKDAIQTHGESLRSLDGEFSSLLYNYQGLFPSYS